MKQDSKRNKIFILSIVLVLLLFFHAIGLLSPVENSIIGLFKPAANLSYTAGSNLSQTYDQITSKKDLRQLLEDKAGENKQLILENAQLQYIKDENETLRQYLNFFNKTSFNYTLAHVIMEQPVINNPDEHNKIMIDKGSSEGLSRGLLAIDQSGMIIGRVSDVNKYKAEISLITSPDCGFAVSVQHAGNVMGIAQGDSGLTVKINFIPQAEAVTVGDTVVTSGLEENLPKGMILGKVSQINKESNELWQNAIIDPLADLDNLLIVSVLLSQTIVEADYVY
ncbi:MAG: rod shape-determining protein MreC [bacterium]